MREYVPMKGPFQGIRYMPSNGDDVGAFMEQWCSHCAHDNDLNGTCDREGRDADEDDFCPVLIEGLAEGSVEEWRELSDGSVVCCAFSAMSFAEAGTRCQHTIDMFADQESNKS